MLEKLVAEFPHNATYQGPLALVLGHFGRLALHKGDRSAARPLLEEALRHEKQALDANPDSPPDRLNHTRLLDDLAAAGRSAQH